MLAAIERRREAHVTSCHPTPSVRLPAVVSCHDDPSNKIYPILCFHQVAAWSLEIKRKRMEDLNRPSLVRRSFDAVAAWGKKEKRRFYLFWFNFSSLRFAKSCCQHPCTYLGKQGESTGSQLVRKGHSSIVFCSITQFTDESRDDFHKNLNSLLPNVVSVLYSWSLEFFIYFTEQLEDKKWICCVSIHIWCTGDYFCEVDWKWITATIFRTTCCYSEYFTQCRAASHTHTHT